MNRFFTLAICLTLLFSSKCQAQFFSNLVFDIDYKVQLLNQEWVSVTNQMDSGKIVLILYHDYNDNQFFDYMGTNTLQNFYSNHGPFGTDQVRIYLYLSYQIWNLNGNSGLNWLDQVGNIPLFTGTSGQFQATFSGMSPYPIGIDDKKKVYCPDRKRYLLHEFPTLLELENLLNIYDLETGVNNASVAWADINTFDHCAGEQRTGKIWLSNNGSSPLTSAKLGVSWNGVEQTTFTWTGNLPTYRHTLLDSLLGSYVNLDNADGTIGVYIKSANGFPDAEAKNDSMFFDTKAAVEVGSQEVVVEYKTHNAPSLDYWDVATDDGEILFSLGDSMLRINYIYAEALITSYPASNTMYTFPIDISGYPTECLKLRCYTKTGVQCGQWLKLISNGDTLIKLAHPDYFIGSDHYDEARFETTFVPTHDIVKIPLQIYPNPSDGMASVVATLPIQENATLSVVNTLGQTIVKQVVIGTGSPQTWEIDTAPFANGVYFVVVQTQEGSSSAMLVVQR